MAGYITPVETQAVTPLAPEPGHSVVKKPEQKAPLSERQQREATAQMLSPQTVQKELLANPDFSKNLEEGRPVFIDVGTPSKPAHAFQFSYYDLPPEARVIFDQRVSKFFEEHSGAGFITHMRPDGLKGMVMTRDAPLDQTLAQIELLMGELESLKKAIAQTGDFALFISEIPELRVGLYPMGRNHAVLEAEQTAGLTMLSWAAKEAGRQSGKNLGRINLVNIASLPQNSDISPSLGEPIVLNAPSEKGVNQEIILRSFRGDASKTTEQQLERLVQILGPEEKLIDYSNLSDTQLDALMRVGGAGFSPRFFSEHFAKDPNLSEDIERNGFMEMQITGEHVSLKFDYSGMSKLVSQGVDPQEFLKGLFGTFAGEVDSAMDGKDYLLGTEGDALILYIPVTGTESKVDRLTKLVGLHKAIRGSYMRELRAGIKSGVLNGALYEHEVGLKTYSSVSDEPVNFRFYKNGVFSIDDKGFSMHEVYGEKRAKQGGAGIAIVSDSRLPDSQAQEIFGKSYSQELLHDGRTLYRMRETSVLEDSFYGALDSMRITHQEYAERISALEDYVSSQVWGNKKISFDLNVIENNSFEAAKWLYIISQMQKDDPEIARIFMENLSTSASPRTVEWFGNLLSQVESKQRGDLQDPVIAAYRLLRKTMLPYGSHVSLSPNQPQSSLGELLQARRDIEWSARREHHYGGNEGEFPWKAYGSGHESYAQTFQSVLEKPFEEMVAENRFRGKPSMILDLMGDGEFIRSLSDLGANGLAVSLVDLRSSAQKKDDASKGIGVIGQDLSEGTRIGDVLSRDTWKRIENWLSYNNGETGQPKSFDLTVIRPEGAMYALPPDEALLYYLLNKAYALTGGTILTQVPGYVSPSMLQRWTKQLQQTEGLDVALGVHQTNYGPERVLRITKKEGAPQALPVLVATSQKPLETST